MWHWRSRGDCMLHPGFSTDTSTCVTASRSQPCLRDEEIRVLGERVVGFTAHLWPQASAQGVTDCLTLTEQFMHTFLHPSPFRHALGESSSLAPFYRWNRFGIFQELAKITQIVTSGAGITAWFGTVCLNHTYGHLLVSYKYRALTDCATGAPHLLVSCVPSQMHKHRPSNRNAWFKKKIVCAPVLLPHF
jgi:hypothetical protein